MQKKKTIKSKISIFKSMRNEFIFGGHFQSLGAACIVFVSAVMLKIKIGWDAFIISYLVFYVIYLFDRFKGIKTDYITNPERTKHIKRYAKWIPVIIVLVIIAPILFLLFTKNLSALIFSLMLLTFGLLYFSCFKKITKKIFAFKNIYVSLFFTAMVFFPVVYYSYSLQDFRTQIIILALFVFLKSFLIQILLDVKDIEEDKKEKLITLPIIFGENTTFKILKLLSIVFSGVIPIVYTLYFDIFPKLFLLFLTTIVFNFYCFYKAKQKKYSGYILASGEFCLWAILILIGKIILT